VSWRLLSSSAGRRAGPDPEIVTLELGGLAASSQPAIALSLASLAARAVNAAVADPATACASVSVWPELFLCLLHRLADVVTTVEEDPADGASLPEPVGTWLPPTAGLVVLVGGDELGGGVVVAEVVPVEGLVVVGEGLAGGGTRAGAVLLLAQLAELDGAGELDGAPGEEAWCDAFTAVLPVPFPPWCEPDVGDDPEVILAGEINDVADRPT
jgi:hypothetical protein